MLHTSLMTRAIRTSNIALEACQRSWIPVKRHWRLNERHYGDLQGKDKTQVREQYGEEQFQLWRRSYDTPPPPIEVGSEWDVSRDPRYAHLTTDLVPRTECLQDVVHRLLPYWYDAIVPDLVAGETVLVAAHGNSLRALVEAPRRADRGAGRRAEHPDRPAAALRPGRRHAPDQPGRHLPRPGGRAGGRGGRGEAGALMAAKKEEERAAAPPRRSAARRRAGGAGGRRARPSGQAAAGGPPRRPARS